MVGDPSSEIKQILSSVLEVNKDLISDEFSPDQAINWDSMRHMKIILALETKYGITFDPDQITEMVTFREICLAVIPKL